MTDTPSLHTLSVLVDNEAGVLSQVSRLFSRKGFNIESLAVGPTDDPALSRITIEVLDQRKPDPARHEPAVASSSPSTPCSLLSAGHSIRRELVLCKVRADSRSVRNEVIQLANIFRASILDVSTASLTLAVIGDETKSEALMTLLREFGILELVRTGIVALERGQHTIRDERKETTEFNLGKSLL